MTEHKLGNNPPTITIPGTRYPLRHAPWKLPWTALALSAVIAAPVLVSAETITVTTNSGGTGWPDCTLRDAINAANMDAPFGGCPAGQGADVIELAPGETYLLSFVDNASYGNNGLPIITSDITINGNGATIQREAGAPSFRILHVGLNASLAINDLRISGGRPGAYRPDGGALSNRGMLILTRVTVQDSVSVDDGGAIANFGTLRLVECVLAGNTAQRSGGGIYNVAAVEMVKSTVARNDSLGGFGGGGVFNLGTLSLENSTVSENAATRDGGGIFNMSSARVELANSSIGRNAATNGGGIYSKGGVRLNNTIVADSASGSDCGGSGYLSRGFNLDSDGTCGLDDVTDIPNGFANLGPVELNGGGMEVQSLLAGSDAVGAGDCGGGSVLVDQRGVLRPQAGACDMGAIELEESTLSVSALTAAENEGTLTFVVTRSHAGHDVSVDVVVTGGTATEGIDFTSEGSYTVTFTAGEVDDIAREITVQILDDDLVEADETVQVTLSNPVNAIADSAAAQGTIRDDDLANVFISDTTGSEGDGDAITALDFTITLSAEVDAEVLVDVQTAAGFPGATEDDFQSMTESVRFAPGETQKSVTVDVFGDDIVEADETFLVRLSGVDAPGRNVALGHEGGTGTILNDDASVIGIDDVTELEGSGGEMRTFAFTVMLDAVVDVAVSVDVSTGPGSASSADNDFVPLATTLEFAPGDTSQIVSVEVVGDDEVEPDETFFVDLLSLEAEGRQVTIGQDAGIGTILNDDEEAGQMFVLNIKPGECPNSFSPKSRGQLPVALLAAEGLDVAEVDLESLRLQRSDGVGGYVVPSEGPPGPHSTIEDVAGFSAGEGCRCVEAAPDGVLDLSLKFPRVEVRDAFGLADLPHGTEIELVLRGRLVDGTPFEATDCMVTVGRGTRPDPITEDYEPVPGGR